MGKYKNTSVIFRKLKNCCIQGRINSSEELANILKEINIEIEQYKEDLIKYIDKRQDCGEEHKYDTPTYTFQRCLAGYVTVYERKCIECGFNEVVKKWEDNLTDITNIEELPEWTKNAKKMYYNNFI